MGEASRQKIIIEF